MKIIKLNAIDSTNSFLKDLAKNATLENFTIVIAKEQTAGKGQMGSNWASEKDKNLTFSILIKHTEALISNQNYLNFALSLAIYDVINEFKVPYLTIKWPNDILSANKKLGGVLIENTLQKNQILASIIGIGINVNQTLFQADLKKATSIKNCINKETDLNTLLKDLQTSIIFYIGLFQQQKFNFLEKEYLSKLYKKDIPATFIDADKNFFMGIITGVSKSGKLQILLENDVLKEFAIKEVSFA